MLLTVFLSIVFCTAMALMLLSAVAFIQDNRFFSSAPKEVREVIIQKDKELFYGARKIGWTLMVTSILMVLGVGSVAIWDGIRSGFTFSQFFTRFVIIFTTYKLCDMILIDYFLLLKSHFFQYFYPEGENIMEGRRFIPSVKALLRFSAFNGIWPKRDGSQVQTKNNAQIGNIPDFHS